MIAPVQAMKTEQLVKLAASGNIKDVEDAWLKLLETEFDAEAWRRRAEVLKALAEKSNDSAAEALATTALESFGRSASPADMLQPAGAFLLALKNSEALRTAVTELYRAVYADIDGLEALLTEAGIAGGRPARRAIRTLEVCLPLAEGACLTHRHEDAAVRVEQIDRDSWNIDVTDGKRQMTLSAVELADNYAPANQDDFNVMARFDRSRLTAWLNDEPGAVVESIVRSNGNELTSDALQRILSPNFIPASEWSKWWTRARSALRNNRHIRIEGRSPYYLKYDPTHLSMEQEVEADLAKAHEPLRELALVEQYVKDCRAHKNEPDRALLERARRRIEERAQRLEGKGAAFELLPYLAAQRIAETYEADDADAAVIAALQRAADPVEAILAVTDASYWPAACKALEDSHPQDLVGALKRLLPHAPLRVADDLAQHLIEMGSGHETFRELADEILREPVRLNEGLLWLWKGPGPQTARVAVPLATIMTRMLAALGEAQRGDRLTRERIRTIAGINRDALKARRFDRFRQMLDSVEPGVAAAMRTQIQRLDNLARTGDDLLKLIREKFPQLTVAAPQVPKWMQEDVLYATEAGYNKRHSELEELVNVKIRENAIAIGRAAELGDLSENSEYKFALEERDLLQARLGQIQREMDIYRVLKPEDVPSDHVGVGCRVVLEHTGAGARQEVTLLGPWESNQDKRIYNYRTPLAQSILGTRLGEVTQVEFFDPPGEYRVTEIHSALQPK
jgi:transcription elongation factor GreA